MEKVRFQQKEESKEKSEQQKPLPPVDFISFVLSLAASAQAHLGLIPSPEGEKVGKNAAMAKQTIDLLGVLEEKTKGNLTPEEEEVLKELLHTLRLQFVEASK